MKTIITILVIVILAAAGLAWWYGTRPTVTHESAAPPSAPVRYYQKLFDSVDKAQEINSNSKERAADSNDTYLQ